MMRIVRLLKILFVIRYYGLDQLALSSLKSPRMRALAWLLTLGRKPRSSRGERLRRALETLGPIFVKFGQVLSTRRDLLPTDVADELAKLQDRVPPFDSKLAIAIIETSLGKPLSALFHDFNHHPVASASVAQVHFAVLRGGPDDGREVAVKVLRPGVRAVIESDLAWLRNVAAWVERVWVDGKRLKPREVVAEFDKYLHDELDLMREAANASQLRRNFAGSDLLWVPEVFWDWCGSEVFVMERMHGARISHVQALRAAGVDLRKLARDGVEIFFTQVFRDGFFHADMHPGNILVSVAPQTHGRYIALDFGIVGALSEFDKHYLAQNFLAFFQRDYRRVAWLHVESGWVPETTRVEELEGAIRTCCEPCFDRPLGQISLGLVLMRLFQTSRRFNMEVQPQLVLLQKTLLNIEGLGRQLDPDLDLWKTAKPFLERWMHEQIGWRGLVDRLKVEAPQWASMLPHFPRLAHRILERQASGDSHRAQADALTALLAEQRRTHRLLSAALLFLCGFAAGVMVAQLLAWIARY